MLPGSFYVRAFVKNYSETVGLDAEEVLRLYQQGNSLKRTRAEVSRARSATSPQRRNHKRPTGQADGVSVLMWSFLLLIIVLVYIFAIKQPTNDKVDSADQTKMTDETKPRHPDRITAKNGDQGQNTSTTCGTTDERPAGAIRGQYGNRRPIRLRIRRRLLRPRRLRWNERPDRPITTMFLRAARIRLN